MFAYKDGVLLVSPEQAEAADGDGAAAARPVLEGLGVVVALDGEAEVRLALCSCVQSAVPGAGGMGDGEEYKLEFREGTEDAGVSVELKLRCVGDMVFGFVDGRIHGGSPFTGRKSFAAKRSISITVDRMGNVSGLMANYQHNDWWTRPHFDPDPARLPPRTVSLLWRDGDACLRLLPVCGPVFRTDLEGGGGRDGQGFSIRLSSCRGGLKRNEGLAFVLGCGAEPYGLADKTADAALRVLDYPVLPRDKKTYPEVLDYLGWCSWDAFYQQVSEENLLAKAEELRRLELPVRWVMIDDGWSSEREGKLMSFAADSGKFPHGLAHTVQALKDRFGMRWVGVWHTIAGYWEGIHPESPLAASLRRYLYSTPDGSLIPYPDAAAGFGFWNAWHGLLRRQGIDFVKTDSQAAIGNFLQYERSVGEAASAAHQALEASVALHFSKTVINCMGMATENIWHRPQSAVSRNSDDFMPKKPGGFREHALQNAYNSYFHGSFYWGDWDMFWSVNHDDLQNAVLRAVSGGPVYISDALDRTDPAKLLPLVYSDGRLLRCDRPAVPAMDCLTADPLNGQVPLKLWNYAGGAGILAAFHLGEGGGEIKGSVSSADIPGFADGEAVIYEHFSGEGRLMEPEERWSFILKPGQCLLFVLVKIREGITPVGLADKYVSPHAIAGQWSSGGTERVRLREGGKFIFHSRRQPVFARVNGEAYEALPSANGIYQVDCSGLREEAIIEIGLDLPPPSAKNRKIR
ncbi:MAG: hypothetical protein K0R57_1959 [Paenibacillaceae bacterium]|jgi:hypothetical protein|nr:hypothetical protein [Paenibacillaceae bacterium]